MSKEKKIKYLFYFAYFVFQNQKYNGSKQANKQQKKNIIIIINHTVLTLSIWRSLRQSPF